MPFADANSQLEPLLFQMKQYKNLTKSTIEILPSSGQANYGPNQKVIFTLPYASTISLEDLALHFTFTSKDLAVASSGVDGGATVCIEKITAPKDVASLISEVDIKINGQTIQHLTRYNDIVNLLNRFQEVGPNQATLSKNLTIGDIAFESDYSIDPADGNVVKGTKTVSRNSADNIVSSRNIINSWYGLLGRRGKEVSSNFIDTNMLGEVTIAFTLAPASVCPAVFMPAATAQNAPTANLTDAEYNSTILNRKTSYVLSDLKMSMVRYNLPQGYSEALASNLSGGAKYQIAFNHYEFHTQNAHKSNGTIRWNENSRDIKGLLAFFTDNERDVSNVPSEYKVADNVAKYFVYENTIHDNSQFQIGSVKMPQNSLKNEEAFLELCRGMARDRGLTNFAIEANGFGIIPKYLEYTFMVYLSLEMTEGVDKEAEFGKKLLSGLSSEQLPISCSYTYNNLAAPGKHWDKSVNIMSLTTRMLVIQNGQNVYVEI
jgi:hypothetical protein